MSSTWEQKLYDGSFDGVTFDFVDTKDTDANSLDKQLFPGRDGQRITPRARAGKSLDITAIFIEEDYPEKMNELIAALSNGGSVKKLVHPVFGELSASADNWTVTHNADDAIDCATVTIKFEISNENASGPSAVTGTTPAQANEVRSTGDATLLSLDAYEASLSTPQPDVSDAVNDAVTQSSAAADNLETNFSDLSVLDIQAQTNGALATCDTAIAMLSDYATTEQYDLSNALLEMSNAVRALAQNLIEQRPPLSIFIARADTNLLSLAFDMGADAEELLTLNSIPDPSFIPAGFQVTAYAA